METNTVLENCSDCKGSEEIFEVGCSCSDCHDHDEGENKTIIRLIAGAVVFVAAIIFENLGIGTVSLADSLVLPPGFSSFAAMTWLSPVFLLFLTAFGVAGYDIIWSAIKNISKGQVFDEKFLMSIASIGAFIIGEYPEAVAVMIFYQVGEQFQDYAVGKSKKSIASLMDIRPDYANLLSADAGTAEASFHRADFSVVSPDTLRTGDMILIKPGEKIPVDCNIITGSSTLDTSALTGESLPKDVGPGAELLSGSVNLSGVIYAEVSKVFGESTVSKILDLVQNAGNKKSKSENFITKFARYYTPIVVGAAVLLAVVPPVVIPGASFHEWIYRALLFLVVSCPCALVLSVPLSFFGGIGGASKSGILIKGGNYLEALARTETVIFDKTGTLTRGVFCVSKINPIDISEEELLRIAAHAESFSNHPISISLKAAYGKEINTALVTGAEEAAGQGVKVIIDQKQVLVGNMKLMDAAGLAEDAKKASDEIGTVVHVAVEGRYSGYIVISDEIKADAKKAVSDLRSVGVANVVMLTGDAKSAADEVGAALGLNNVFSELLPVGKVEIAEQLLSEKSAKGTLVFVGDGINDAPVLARADIGVAMGGVGSDAAIEAADVVIMTDEPSKVAAAIKISRRTIAIANQNIAFALGIKALVLLLGALGAATMWEAIFADVGVSVLAVLNALRALQAKA